VITFKVWVRHPEGLPDLICPVVLCDGCREEIVGPGNVLWIDSDGGQVWHTHKGACDRKVSRAIRQAHGTDHEWSRELSEWIAQLHRNVSVDAPPCALPDERRSA
jgi:hypothetical protein